MPTYWVSIFTSGSAAWAPWMKPVRKSLITGPSSPPTKPMTFSGLIFSISEEVIRAAAVPTRYPRSFCLKVMLATLGCATSAS